MRGFFLLTIFVTVFLLGAFAQLPGVNRYGVFRDSGSEFVSRHGGVVDYPSLNRYGQILHYAPIVVMDSVSLSSTSVTTARFYGAVVFNGWSPLMSCGFDYAASPDFAGYQRVDCALGEKGTIIAEIEGLSFNQQYFVRSFARNLYGISYADTFSFHTTVGPVEIESVRAFISGPYSFDVSVLLRERGGLPVSGELDVFADEGYQNLVLTEPVGTIVADSVKKTFSDLAPSTVYYVQAVLTNGVFSDTVRFQVRTPSDLVLTLESDAAASVSLCTGGTEVVYKATLSGTDRNKPLYHFLWSVSSGSGVPQDTTFTVLYGAAGSYVVSAKAVYGEDTIAASRNQGIRARSGSSSFYVCTNEFLNTAEATTTNIASICWLDANRDTVGTTNSVKLPTGNYTVECTDTYGCRLSKEVYIGKKQLSCTVSDMPGSHESARWEEGVWKIDSISDEDGYWYAVTQIGNQCWLRQNLRTRHLPSTHQDILGTGNSYIPDMMYNNSSYVYDPESTPYYGAVYNWCAAVDVPFCYRNNSEFTNYTNHRQGMCPAGWHIPCKADVWEMVATVLNICCEGVDYMPALGIDGRYVAQNTIINHMMLSCCYDSYSNPAYPREIYDAVNLTLPEELTSLKFWIVDLHPADYTGYAFTVSRTKAGVSVGNAPRYGQQIPVRCIRDSSGE